MSMDAGQERISRRRFVQAVAAGIVSAGVWGDLLVRGEAASLSGPPMSAAEALRSLKDGNARAAAGKFTLVGKLASQRVRTATEQRPFAIILGCADSRVPVELVFDHGIGELFVVRVAGNTSGALVDGSIEYAVEHFHVPLLVVLGHQRCGAVAAAIESVKTGRPAPGHIDSLLVPIRPIVRRLGNRPDLLDAAVTANAQSVAAKLRSDGPLAEAVAKGTLTITSAVYSLDTGRVRWLG